MIGIPDISAADYFLATGARTRPPLHHGVDAYRSLRVAGFGKAGGGFRNKNWPLRDQKACQTSHFQTACRDPKPTKILDTWAGTRLA